MARTTKKLTNTEIERARPKAKEYSLADGDGFPKSLPKYLWQVFPLPNGECMKCGLESLTQAEIDFYLSQFKEQNDDRE